MPNDIVRFLTIIRIIETMTAAMKMGKLTELTDYRPNASAGIVYDKTRPDARWSDVCSGIVYPIVQFIRLESNLPEFYYDNTGIKVLLHIPPVGETDAKPSIFIDIDPTDKSQEKTWIEIDEVGWSIENLKDRPIWYNTLPCFLSGNPNGETERFQVLPG